LRALVDSWSTGGHMDENFDDIVSDENGYKRNENDNGSPKLGFLNRKYQTLRMHQLTRDERAILKAEQRIARKKARQKARSLKEAAKVVVDYRPVMSKIIDDYLFRCPSWHLAQLLSEERESRGVADNVFVYRFSQPTHIPGYKECWGKSCHTAELPYVFESMGVIRSNYSTLGPIAQEDAPKPPEYPYTEILEAYRGAVEAADNQDDFHDEDIHNSRNGDNNTTYTNRSFQKILSHFFGDYFTVDADEELASDMAERWSSFARGGDPNYDGSKAEWLPWWKHKTSAAASGDDNNNDPNAGYPWKSDGEAFWNADEGQWTDFESDFHSPNEDGGFYDEFDEEAERDKNDRYYRRKALEALELQVREEDMFRTELKRVQGRHGLKEHAERSFLSGKWFSGASSNDHTEPGRKQSLDEVLRMAQDMGVMGEGLRGQETMRPEFLPEFLELSWPPEGRLIERDCTCDMWDRIRYRY